MSCSINGNELNITNLLSSRTSFAMPDYTKLNERPSRNGEYFTKIDSEKLNAYKALTFSSDGCSSPTRTRIKIHPIEDVKDTTPSIIGLSKKCANGESVTKVSRVKTPNRGNTFHESLQRIGGADILFNHYQKYWFSSSIERLKLEDKSREERLEITRYELQRHLRQLIKTKLGNSNEYLNSISSLELDLYYRVQPKAVRRPRYDSLVPRCKCDLDKCEKMAMPCTRFCALHIMHCPEQVLFNYCTAKFADNTQCSVPVFDIMHELPLCREHARKRDNYQLHQDTKPRNGRKKIRLHSPARLPKRSKKKKKLIKGSAEDAVRCKSEGLNDVASTSHHKLLHEDVGQSLALHEGDGFELVSVEQGLVPPTTNLLEESEINNVLSTIQVEEFDDFFTVNRNGDYEPTHEETEELERALAAVDNDVKSLEKLSQSQGLLDSFLDDHTLVESLVQLPDVFHNGYVTCGDNIVTQNSRLLSVEPNSHSECS